MENAILKRVSSPDELMREVRAGVDQRIVGTTVFNKESSRSHMFILLVLRGKNKKTGEDRSTSKV